MLKTQNWKFIKVALTRWFCTTACQQAHWTMLSLLQVMFCFKGNAPLLSSRRRLLKNELTCAYQVNLTYFMHKARKKNTLSYFELDETSLEFSKQIANDCPLDQEFFTGKYRKHRRLSCVAPRFRDSCWTKRQPGTTWSLQDRGSCAVPKMLKIPRDQAKHFAVVVVCYKASPKRSRSRQSKESAVDSSNTQKSKRLLRFRAKAQLRNNRGPLPRGDEHYRVRMQTDMEEFDRVANEKKDLHRFSWRKALLQRPIQGRPTPPRRRQRHRRDRRTHWIQTDCTVEKGNMTSHSLDPDAAQWSSWSSWTWSPSTRSSWWDYSSPLQSWRQSPWPTATDFTANVLNSRARVTEHKHRATWCCEANQWA